MRRALAAALALGAALTASGWGAPAIAGPLPAEGAGPCQQTTTTYIADPPLPLDQLGAKDAWGYSTGEGVVVAVVDSGVDDTNAHLGAAVLPGTDLTGAWRDGRQDTVGLGTAIAGLIAARPVDGSGLVGVAPSATILPVRVYQQSVRGDYPHAPNAEATAQGIVWAADHGAKVIVVPTAFTSDSGALRAAVDHAMARGALTIAPVGDASSQAGELSNVDAAPRYPAAYTDAVLGVTALGADGAAGPDVVHNATVQLAAPGTSVMTSYLGLGDCLFAPDKASSAFAAGYVAGVAALVAARHPDESPQLWRYRLLVTASRPAPAQRDDDTGWGVVAPVPAIGFVNDGTAVGPPNPLGAAPAAAPPPPLDLAPTPTTGPLGRDQLALGVSVALAGLVWVLAVLRRPARRQP